MKEIKRETFEGADLQDKEGNFFYEQYQTATPSIRLVNWLRKYMVYRGK